MRQWFSLSTMACILLLAGGLRQGLNAFDGGSGLALFAISNGDTNGDWERDLSDAIYLFSHHYLGGPPPVPLAFCGTEEPLIQNGDADADGTVDLSDGISLLGYLFIGGPAPVSPCGDGGGADKNVNPRVLPPHSKPYGKTYGEWTASWWQWAISIPVPVHPLFDAGGCDTGQSGPVWFLGGAFTGTATVRECTVPEGKSILIPIANVECSTVEPPPFFGGNEEELRACAKSFMDTATITSFIVDGKALGKFDKYRVQSPVYSFDAPADNVLFIPGPVSGLSVSDGVWILLAPLSEGHHTIHFVASFPGFPLDVTYHLTVD